MTVAEYDLTVTVPGGTGGTYSTASITPTAGRLVLASTMSLAGGGGPETPTLSGCGLTWVLVATRAYANSQFRVSVFRAMGASPSAGAVTITYSGTLEGQRCCSIAEFSGVAGGGTNGSEAIVQAASAAEETGSTTALVTLSAFTDTKNATYSAVGANSNVLYAGSGFTQIHLGSTNIFLTEWRFDNDTTVDAAISGSGSTWGIIGVEIAALVIPTPHRTIVSQAVQRAATR